MAFIIFAYTPSCLRISVVDGLLDPNMQRFYRWTFEEPGFFTFSLPSLASLYNTMSIPPIISNAHVDQDNIFYNVYQRQVIVTSAGLRIAILVISDWSRPVYPLV